MTGVIRILTWMPCPTSCLHNTLPSARERQTASRLWLLSSVALTKTWSPHATGVDAARPGSSATHLTASVLENFSGNPVSVVEPLWNGPRQLGQSAAFSAGALPKIVAASARRGMVVFMNRR